MALKTDYKDYIPPSGGRKYKITANSDGSSSVEDITQYQQVGDTWGAEDINSITERVNDTYTKIESDARYATAAQGLKADAALPAAGGALTGLIRTQGQSHEYGIEIGESASKSVRLVYTSAGYMLGRYVDDAWKYNIVQHNPSSFNTSFYIGENLYSNGLALTDTSEGYALRPTGDGGLKLGTSDRRWGQIYSNVGSISTSDVKEKNTVEPLTAEKAGALLEALEPVTYKLNHGESGRTHWGLIAQQVENAMESAGITDMEFAGLIRSPQEDGTDRYGLRYEEFIAPLVAVVQSQKQEIAALRTYIEQQFAALGL